MIGALGSDAFADTLIGFLDSQKVDVSLVSRVDGPSGMALISLDDAGENSIIVIPGANNRVAMATLTTFAFAETDVLLLQNEVPDPVNVHAAACAKQSGAKVILNTAPYRELSAGIGDNLDFVVANETEFSQLIGESGHAMTAHRVAGLLSKGMVPVPGIIVTLGSAGVVARAGDEVIHIAGHQVPVRDSTGAGDCFCGTLAAAIARGESLDAALRYANAAAALSVQQLGASPSMPQHQDIIDFLARQ
jgi:ribokinase